MIDFNSSLSPRTRNNYSVEEKFAIIQEYISTPIPMSHMARKYHIGHETIPKWMSTFGIPMPKVAPSSRIMIKSDLEKCGPATVEALRAQLKALQDELDRERLMNLALNTMIDITEEEFHIEIRKKAGAKR
jgi:transposase-like protein